MRSEDKIEPHAPPHALSICCFLKSMGPEYISKAAGAELSVPAFGQLFRDAGACTRLALYRAFCGPGVVPE